MSLEISSVVVTPFVENCWILSSSGVGCVIDPGGDVELILNELGRRKLTCKEIWLTHSHLDHCGGVLRLQEATGAKLFGHRIEQSLRENVDLVCNMYGIPPGVLQNCPEPDTYIDEGDSLYLGEEKFNVLFTPGHSPGHLCFYNSKHGVLIGGDVVFQGSIGRSDLPGGDERLLMRSIKEKVLKLPAETRILPGHGPETTVGIESKTNPFFR